MIDEKKLIKEIKDAINSDRFHGYTPDAVLFEVFDMIQEQPKVGEWIPCSERLPEPYDVVLVTAKIKDDVKGPVYKGSRSGSGWMLAGVKNLEQYVVIAWQPLPEPYKESDEYE